MYEFHLFLWVFPQYAWQWTPFLNCSDNALVLHTHSIWSQFIWCRFTGQWLPMVTDSGSHQLHAEVSESVDDVVKNLLLYLVPQQSRSQQEITFSSIQHAYESLKFIERMKLDDLASRSSEMTFDVSVSFGRTGLHSNWQFPLTASMYSSGRHHMLEYTSINYWETEWLSHEEVFSCLSNPFRERKREALQMSLNHEVLSQGRLALGE